MDKNKKIRAIISDVDETFITTDKQSLPENFQAVRDAQAAGIGFAFASGRYWPSLREWGKELNLTIPQILDNGASLFDPVQEKIIESITIDDVCLHFFYDRLSSAGYFPILCTCTCYYATSVNEHTQRESMIRGEYMEVVPEAVLFDSSRKYEKLEIFDIDHAAKLERLVEQITADANAANLSYTSVFTEKGIWVLTAKGVNKAHGVASLSRALGCLPEEIAAVGDGDNDAGMLAAVGRSFAVANATALAKQNAKEIVPSNNDAGFAYAVRRILEEQGK